MKNRRGQGLLIGILLIVVVVGVFIMFSGGDSKETAQASDEGQKEEPIIENTVEETTEPDTQETIPNQDSEEEQAKSHTFVLTGRNFKFVENGVDNPDLVVNKGDTVRIEFSSTSGFHDWVVDEFNAATKQVAPKDGTTTVEFVADKSGTFEYYCSVGSHRASGMKGRLVVN